MKATLIISSEYHANTPSVFAYANEKYYGCQMYPKARNYPADMDYWRNTTSSDSDRDFYVVEVEYSADDFSKIQELQNTIFENIKMLKDDDLPWITNTLKDKESVEQKEAQRKLIKEVFDYNRPFEEVIYKSRRELRALLLKELPKNEN